MSTFGIDRFGYWILPKRVLCSVAKRVETFTADHRRIGGSLSVERNELQDEELEEGRSGGSALICGTE